MSDDTIDRLRPGPRSAADKLTIKISESKGRRDRVTNRAVPWPKFAEQLSHTVRDNITRKQYLALSEKEQQDRKNQGYFVGGQFDKGVRKVNGLAARSIATFDIDQCSLPLASELVAPFDGWLSDKEYVVYSTRSHTRERPRLRVVIPFTREVNKDEFTAVCRIIAFKLDATMETVDPVSFRPAQVMFFPSTNKGEDFLYHHNRGELVNPDGVLTEFGADWSNYDKLPISPRETKARQTGAKVQDPRSKRGIVGAFCRTYDIPGVIDQYLSDIYAPGDDDDRYTYVNGTSTNGLVVYDGGMQAFSHHGSDPNGGLLSNPFDLMRRAKFSDLDKGDDEDDPTKLPSYKAMVAFLQDDADVMREYSNSLYDHEAMADDATWEEDLEDDDPGVTPPGAIGTEARSAAPKPKEKPTEPPTAEPEAEPPPPAAARDWRDDLDRAETGAVKNTLHNLILILENDGRFKGALAYNELLEEPVLVRRIRSKQYGHDTGPIRNAENGDMISPSAHAAIRAVLEGPRGEKKTGWGLRVSERDLFDAMNAVSWSHRFHPIQRYLKAVKWDGKPRLSKMLHTYWHAADTNYHSVVGYNFMMAAIARVFEPGHKFDFVMILEGLQELRKSTSFAALAGSRFFAEFNANVERKNEVIENIQGKWIVEIGELIAFLKGENEVLKALFSGTETRTRLAYGRGAKDYPRRNVFVGTTNEHEYLKDKTGNRRYWIVKIPNRLIDTDGIAADRDQLWAEAYQEYLWMRRVHPDISKPLPLYLRGEVNEEAKRMQSARMVTDADSQFIGQIHEWLETPVPASQAAAGWRDDGSDVSGDGEKLILRQMVCVRDAAVHCLGLDERKLDYRTCRLIGNSLNTAEGWQKKAHTVRVQGQGKIKVWIREDEL